MDLDDIETFVGFYSADGFWVGESIDLIDSRAATRLAGIVPEIVVQISEEKFKAAVCVDGLILLRIEHLANTVPNAGDALQFNESVKWWDEHLDYANALLLCLESESIKCPRSSEALASAVTIDETCRVGFVDGCAVNRNQSRGRSMVSLNFELALWIAGGRKGPEPWRATTDGLALAVVSQEAIRSALKQFKLIVENAELVKWLSFMAKAKSAYQNNDYRVSFTLLWFVIESAAKSLWIGLSRSEKRNPTMDAITRELHKRNLISNETRDLVDRLRKGIRNRLMHEPASTVCLPEDCQSAARAAIDLAVRNPEIGLVQRWGTGVAF